VLVLGLALPACKPPAPAIAPAPETPITPTPVVAEPEPSKPPVLRVGPFRRESPILFQPSDTHAVIEPVTKAVRGWASSRDGATRVEIGCSKGVRVIDGAGARTIGKTADHVAIANDGSDVAHEQAGKIRHGPKDALAIDGTNATFLDGGVLVFRRGCAWFAGSDAQPLGESCGTPIRVERDHARLWLAEVDPPSKDPEGRERKAVRAVVGLEPNAPAIRVELVDGGPMYGATLSADASILCATFDEAGHDVLQCRLREGGVFERVAKDVFGTPMFADDAPRMVFTVGDRTHPPRDLHLVDFTHKIIRKLGRIAHHRIEFLPGAEHVVAYDGARGLVFELDTGLVTAFGEESDDWVALAGAAQRGSFLASRLRRQCAQLVRVRLPDRDSGSAATDTTDATSEG